MLIQTEIIWRLILASLMSSIAASSNEFWSSSSSESEDKFSNFNSRAKTMFFNSNLKKTIKIWLNWKKQYHNYCRATLISEKIRYASFAALKTVQIFVHFSSRAAVFGYHTYPIISKEELKKHSSSINGEWSRDQNYSQNSSGDQKPHFSWDQKFFK